MSTAWGVGCWVQVYSVPSQSLSSLLKQLAYPPFTLPVVFLELPTSRYHPPVPLVLSKLSTRYAPSLFPSNSPVIPDNEHVAPMNILFPFPRCACTWYLLTLSCVFPGMSSPHETHRAAPETPCCPDWPPRNQPLLSQ